MKKKHEKKHEKKHCATAKKAIQQQKIKQNKTFSDVIQSIYFAYVN